MDLLLAKIWYFFYFGGLVCVWPYINIFYRSHGLTDSQIGILAAIKPWVSAPASFLWSGLADRHSAYKTIMIVTFVTSTLTRTSVAFFSTFAAFMVLAAVGEFLAAPVGVMADAAVVAACQNDADYGKSRLWGAVAWGSLSAFSGGLVAHFGINAGFAAYLLLSVPCVVCAWKMEFLLGARKCQQHQQRQQQQQDKECNSKPQDTWCVGEAKSFRIGKDDSLELLQLVETAVHSNDTSESDVMLDVSERQQLLSCQQSSTGDAPYPSQAPAASANLKEPLQNECVDDVQVLVDHSLDVQHQPAKILQQRTASHGHANLTATLGSSRSSKYISNQLQRPDNFWISLQQLLSSPAVIIFMWQATVMGFGIGVIGEFLFLFLQDLGGSETLMGFTLTVTCIAEVPAFHYQPQLLKIVSVHTMLHIVMWAYVVRLGLYALLPYVGTPWAVLPVELLHGLCFGCGWSAGTITSKRVAPAGLEATMQGIFQGLYFGLGQGLGALIGGFLKNTFDGQIMFALCAGICFCGWLVCIIAEYFTGTVHATDEDHASKSRSLPRSQLCDAMQGTSAAAAAADQQPASHDVFSTAWSASDQDYPSVQQYSKEQASLTSDTRSSWLKARAAAASRLIGSVRRHFFAPSNAGYIQSSSLDVHVPVNVGLGKNPASRKLKYAELASKDSGRGPDLYAAMEPGVYGLLAAHDGR